MNVIRHMTVEQPRPRVPNQHLHHFKGSREQIHNICSVAFAILSKGREAVSVQCSVLLSQEENSICVAGEHFRATTAFKSSEKDFKD